MPAEMSTSEIQSELCEVADALTTWRAIAANASERRPGNEKLIYSPAQVCELSIMLLETICDRLNVCIDALDKLDIPTPEPEPQREPAKLKTLVCNRDQEPDPRAADPDPDPMQ